MHSDTSSFRCTSCIFVSNTQASTHYLIERSFSIGNLPLIVLNLTTFTFQLQQRQKRTMPFDFSSISLRTLKRRKQEYTINEPETSVDVIYLGNVLTAIAKGDAAIQKPLQLIWKTYESRTRPDMPMRLRVTRQGLKAETKQQGLTEYWAHRTTYCVAPTDYPRVFCWVYKHEGKKMKPEVRLFTRAPSSNIFCFAASLPRSAMQTSE